MNDAALHLPHESVTFHSESGSEIRGWYVPSVPSAGTIVLMHGVRSDRLSMVNRASFLHDAGYSVLLFDFQGHGESTAKHITMGYLESRDTQAAVSYVRSRSPSGFVGAIGVSLGGAAAVLGSKPLAVDALVLEAVYPNIEAATSNRIRERLGWLGPVLSPVLLAQLRPRFGISSSDLSPATGIRNVTAPLLIIAGDADHLTTVSDTNELYAAAPAPKTLWMIHGAGHVDFSAYAGRAYQDRILAFFGKYRGGTQVSLNPVAHRWCRGNARPHGIDCAVIP